MYDNLHRQIDQENRWIKRTP